MQGLNLAVNFTIILLHIVKEVVCPSSRSWDKGGTEQEFHHARKFFDTGKKLPCFAKSVLSAMKNGDIWQHRLEHKTASAFTSYFTSSKLLDLSVPKIPYFHNRDNNSNCLIRFWGVMNELTYDIHLELC